MKTRLPFWLEKKSFFSNFVLSKFDPRVKKRGSHNAAIMGSPEREKREKKRSKKEIQRKSEKEEFFAGPLE